MKIPAITLDYWRVYDPERIARQNAEIEKWWQEIPMRPDRTRWSGDAKRPAPQFGRLS